MKSAKLKAWRKKHRVSQAKLAKELGIAVLTVSRWERGESAIPPYLHLALESVARKREERNVVSILSGDATDAEIKSFVKIMNEGLKPRKKGKRRSAHKSHISVYGK